MTPGLRCHVCGSRRLADKPFGYRFREQWLGGVECRSCGIIFLDPQPTEDDYRAMYSREYFEGDFRCGHEGSYFDDATHVRLRDAGLIDRIRQFVPKGNFLEIGCAGGAFLDTVRKYGYNVYGVEFSEDAAQFAREKFDLDVVTGDVQSAHYPEGTFNVVFLGDVLEHLPDPRATMKEIHRITADGGVVVILCPMQTNTLYSRIGFIAYRLLGRKAVVKLPPYHVFEYRGGSMEQLLRKSGFAIARRMEMMIPPSQIAMRNSPLQNALKKLFQYPNFYFTRTFNRLGDRIEMYAVKGERTTR